MRSLAAALALLAAAAAPAQTSEKLVGNTGAASLVNVTNGVDFAQSFTTGTNSEGYKLTRVDIRMLGGSGAGPTYSVSIHSDSSTCTPTTLTSCPGTSLGTLTNPAMWPSTAGPARHDAPSGGIDLAKDTTYWLVFDITGNISSSSTSWLRYETSSDDEDSGAATGWSIGNGSLWRFWGTATGWGNTDTTSLLLDIHGYAKSTPSLVSNLGAASPTALRSRFDIGQPFTTGTNSGGYKLTRADIRMLGGSGTAPTYSVSIHEDSSTCMPTTLTSCPGTSLGTLTNPASWPSTAGPAQHAAPSGGIDLAKETTYWLLFNITANPPLSPTEWLMSQTASDDEDAGAAPGWTLGNAYRWKNWDASDWVTTNSTNSLLIAIFGDAVASPTVTGVAVVSDPTAASDTYGLGETIRVQLTFSEAVTVTGTPRLKIKMDPDYGEKWAVYASGSGTAMLQFSYTVVSPNLSAGGIAVLENTLELNGGTIKSTASQADAALAHAGLPHNSAHKVNHALGVMPPPPPDPQPPDPQPPDPQTPDPQTPDPQTPDPQPPDDDEVAPPRTTVPGAPRRLTAVGGDGEVELRWSAPDDNGGEAITDYEYRINGKGDWISIGSTETTYTVSGLENGAEYSFQVRAVNENGAGRASRSSRAEVGAALGFAHFANGDGIASDLVFVNVGTQQVRPAIYFYDSEGEPIAAESLVEVAGDLEIAEDGAVTVRTEMEPLTELTISTHGRGALLTGSVRVTAGNRFGGMLRYDLPHVGEAVVGPGSPIGDAIFPVRRREGGINTGVAIHNLEEEPLEVSCRLLRGGVVLEHASLPLAANGQASWTIDAAFPGVDTSGFAGSVRCDAVGRGRFSAVALEVDPGAGTFTTLPVFPVNGVPGGRAAVLDFAHFANGDGAATDLVLMNVGIWPIGPALSPLHTPTPPMRPAIYFYDTEGNPIAARSVVDVGGDLEVQEDGGLTVRTAMEPLTELTISTHGRGALLTGSVRVVAENRLGGMLRFDLPHVGEAVVGPGSPIGDAIFPVRRREGGINTGVAIHNLGWSSQLVRCELLREGVQRDVAMIPLAANGRSSWTIDQVFTATDLSDFSGSLRCGRGGVFTVVALEVDPGARTFITLPVFPVEERPDRE